jgi:hypothetical protein
MSQLLKSGDKMKTARLSGILLESILIVAGALGAARASAATITVTGTGDAIAVDGVVTLREAITSINNAANVNADVVAVGTYGTNDQIVFNIPGTGVQTISPGSALPTIAKPVSIDGYTQPGASPNTLAIGENAVLRIELTGTGGGVGLDIQTTGATIRGLVINGFNSAIRIFISGGSNRVVGNFLGVDPTGMAARSNGAGVLIIDLSNNTIGGTAPADRNIVSASNPAGVDVSGGSANVIQGNYIGTNATGTAAIPNVFGVELGNSNNGVVGGTASGAGNLISGNTSEGIAVSGTSNIVQGNLIGTDVTGSAPIGNGSGGVAPGVFIADSNNTIGGTAAGAANIIAFNSGPGVEVLGGTGNAIRGNSIFSNTKLGIDLGGDGVTPNDSCDVDTGPNNLQNFPVLTTALSSGGNTTIQGTLNSTPSTTYQVDFFSNASCDPSGHGQGQTFLGSTVVTTDGSCNGSFNVTLPVTVSPQTRLTATATDPANNTSEFSACISLQAQYHTVTPCRVADTRGATGPYGGPPLAANGDRTFVVGGQCGIPATAQAVSFNFTITQPTGLGDLRTFPGGGTLPLVSTMNWRPGQTRANNAIVPLGPSGDIVAHVDQASGTVHLIIDVNGYFQ